MYSSGIECADPYDVANADKSGGHFYGDSVTYQCHTGYQMTSGDSVLHCGVTGFWSGTKPTCSSKLRCFILHF